MWRWPREAGRGDLPAPHGARAEQCLDRVSLGARGWNKTRRQPLGALSGLPQSDEEIGCGLPAVACGLALHLRSPPARACRPPGPPRSPRGAARRFAAFDGPEVAGRPRAQRARVDQIGDTVQDLVLADHVVGLEHRTREHRLPVDGDALHLHQAQVQRPRIVDQAEPPLRRDAGAEIGPDLRGRMGGKDVAKRAPQSQALDLCLERSAVVDHMVGPQVTDPRFACGT